MILSRLRQIPFQKIVIALFGVLAALVLLEIILRYTDVTEYSTMQRDPESNLLIYKPNSTFRYALSCFDREAEINSRGFHGEEYADEKEEGVFRVVVMGASFVEALQVSIEDMFSTALENELNAQNLDKTVTQYEVIPIAFSGIGTYFNILYYERFAKQLDADLVVYFVPDLASGHEIVGVQHPPTFDEDGSVIVTFPPDPPTGLKVDIKNMMRKSKLIMNIHKRVVFCANYIRAILDEPNLFLKQRVVTEGTSEVLPVLEKLIKEEELLLTSFKSIVEGDGAEFVLAAWQVENDNHEAKEGYRREMVEKANISYIDLRSGVAEREEQKGLSATWSCDGHWTKAGNEYAASTLLDYLTEKEIVE